MGNLQDQIREQILESSKSNSSPYMEGNRKTLKERSMSITRAFKNAMDKAKQGQDALRKAKDTDWARKYHRNKKAVNLQKVVDPNINKVYTLASPSQPTAALVPYDPEKYPELDSPMHITIAALMGFELGLTKVTRKNLSRAMTFIHNYGNTDFDKWLNAQKFTNVSFDGSDDAKQRVDAIIRQSPDVEDQARPKGVATIQGKDVMLWVKPGGNIGAVLNESKQGNDRVRWTIDERTLPGFDDMSDSSVSYERPHEYARGLIIQALLKNVMESPRNPEIWPRNMGEDYEQLKSNLRVWLEGNIEQFKDYFEQEDWGQTDLESKRSMKSAFGRVGIEEIAKDEAFVVLDDLEPVWRKGYEVLKKLHQKVDVSEFQERVKKLMDSRNMKELAKKFERLSTDIDRMGESNDMPFEVSGMLLEGLNEMNRQLDKLSGRLGNVEQWGRDPRFDDLNLRQKPNIRSLSKKAGKVLSIKNDMLDAPDASSKRHDFNKHMNLLKKFYQQFKKRHRETLEQQGIWKDFESTFGKDIEEALKLWNRMPKSESVNESIRDRGDVELYQIPRKPEHREKVEPIYQAVDRTANLPKLNWKVFEADLSGDQEEIGLVATKSIVVDTEGVMSSGKQDLEISIWWSPERGQYHGSVDVEGKPQQGGLVRSSGSDDPAPVVQDVSEMVERLKQGQTESNDRRSNQTPKQQEGQSFTKEDIKSQVLEELNEMRETPGPNLIAETKSFGEFKPDDVGGGQTPEYLLAYWALQVRNKNQPAKAVEMLKNYSGGDAMKQIQHDLKQSRVGQTGNFPRKALTTIRDKWDQVRNKAIDVIHSGEYIP